MEISLKSFVLIHPAFAINGSCAAVAELVWPRPAISSRVGIIPLDLRQGKAVLPKSPAYKRLLLKERVDGNFGLVVGITKPGKGSLLNEAMAEIFSQAFSTIGSGLSAYVGNSALRGLLREPFKQLGYTVEDDEPVLVAEAGIDLDSESDWIGQKKFELKTTKTLRMPTEPKAGPRTKNIAKKQKHETVRKGSVIAEAVLELSKV